MDTEANFIDSVFAFEKRSLIHISFRKEQKPNNRNGHTTKEHKKAINKKINRNAIKAYKC